MSESDFRVAVLVAIAVVAVLMIVVALPVVITTRQASRDREYQHVERLKALELGQPFPGEPPTAGSPGHGGTGIGVWVPIGVMAIALAATHGSGDSPAAVATWVAAGSVGVAGVICGTILAMNAPSRKDPATRGHSPSKPAVAEDDFGIVSRRG